MSDGIPLFQIDVGTPEVRNAVDSLTRGSFWAKGPYVDEFESKIEEFLGVEHAVTVNSGTTALVTALTAAVEEGEVIVPSFTFIATANAVRLAGLEPKFADIESETLGLDPDSVERAITDETTAILPIHPYGAPCRIGELREIADEHDLVLIEDAAESFGSTHEGRMTGTFGEVSALSFCQNKVITTGEGGAVVTDDDEIAQRARLFRSHGRSSEGYFESRGSGSYVTLGSNYRMNDMTAAVGAGQMDRAESIIDRRREVGSALTRRLAEIDGVRPHPEPTEARHVYQIFTAVFDSEEDREAVATTLADRDIDSKVYWDPPVHQTEYYADTDAPELPVTERLASRVLSLPMYTQLSSTQIDRIVDGVRDGLE